MTAKKEIKVKKSFLTLILKSILLLILTLFLIQHFGKIRGEQLWTYPKSYIFENPVNNSEYSCFWYDGQPSSNGVTSDRSKYMLYLIKLKKFYIPSLLGNPIHILNGTLLFAGIFACFGNYKLKLSYK